MGIFGMTDMGRFMIITMCSIVFLVFIMRVIGRNTGKRDEFMNLVKDGNFKEAIDYCQDQIDSGNLKKRKLARVYLDQAIAYQRVGMFQKSLECLETMNPGYLRKEESMAFNTYYTRTNFLKNNFLIC